MITRSLPHTVKTIEGNGLAVFVDDTDSELKVKDVNGQVFNIADLISNALENRISFTKAFSLHDPDTSDIILLRTDHQYLIQEVYSLAQGVNPEISYNIYFAPSYSDTPTQLWDEDKLITGESAFTEFDHSRIDSANVIWFKINSLSGSDLKFHTTITFIKIH